MLEHLNEIPTAPRRVVVMGAGGFVGSVSAERLRREGVDVLALTRKEVDLLADEARAELSARLSPDDCLIVTSAIAPCRDNAMLLDNIRMMMAVCGAVTDVPVAHLIYISSDAVYADSPNPLTEKNCAEPGSLHGMMHIARETMLKASYEGPLCILRPSLLYGTRDPHNGYGPNKFRRAAAAGEDIVLFGEGEERRDHVLIDDVGEIVSRCVRHRSRGVLNIATGSVTSFHDIAESVLREAATASKIVTTPRQGPMPHDGYRPFDIAASRAAFPDFTYTSIDAGIVQAHAEMAGGE